MKQIYTHIKALLTGFCSFIKPNLQNPHPFTPYYFIKKMLLKNISSIITMVISTNVFKFRFSILVSVDRQKCGMVRHTSKHRVAHNPALHSQHLNFVLSWFWQMHTAPNSLTLLSQCLLSHESTLFSWLVDGGSSSLSCGQTH
jgi:hypothetical protein